MLIFKLLASINQFGMELDYEIYQITEYVNIYHQKSSLKFYLHIYIYIKYYAHTSSKSSMNDDNNNKK